MSGRPRWRWWCEIVALEFIRGSRRPSRPTGTGLSVIQALSRRVALGGGDDRGTEVRMTFDTPRASTLDPVPAGEPELRTVAEAQPGGAIRIVVAPPLLCRAILPRLLSALAARVHFTTDRLADTQLVADELCQLRCEVDQRQSSQHRHQRRAPRSRAASGTAARAARDPAPSRFRSRRVEPGDGRPR